MINKELKTWATNTTLLLGAAMAVKLLISIPKLIINRVGQRKYDLLLEGRNKKISEAQDKYNEGGLVPNDPREVSKYLNFLHDLYEDTLKLELRSVTNKDLTVFDTHIKPLIALVSLVTISDVYLFAGEATVIDRRSLELVYAPGSQGDVKSVVNDPHRRIIYKGRWPKHNFQVRTMGVELNPLVDGLFRFLASNQQYLAIRL